MRPNVFQGQRYGHLLVEEQVGHAGTKRLWRCLCDCGTRTSVVSPHLRSGHTTSCGCRRVIAGLQRRTPILDRFWARVSNGDGCWTWTGHRNEDGYGSITSGGRGGKHEGAHRFSWRLHNGEIPDGMSVLHHCDNPPCVNPKHLFLGTQRDNMQDCARKSRVFIREQRGESNASAKLSNDQVVELRDAYAGGALQSDLASRYDVTQSCISAVVRGEVYRDAGGPITNRPKNASLNQRRWG